MTQSSFHEPFSPSDDVKVGSERSFGIVFAVVFTLIGLFPLWVGADVRIWALLCGGVFLGLAFIAPGVLAPLNRAWFRFGLLLHKIISPLVMGLMFFAVFMPIGLLMRVLGKRPLDLGFDRHVNSYWVHRTPPAPEPGSMKRQF